MTAVATAFATPAAEAADDPIYQTDFIREMLRQTRALDSYGQWDG